ncbi:MAG TPA: hypothetical protein VHQ01_06105, partial [Pyrinomonadaceae bacterium]|nr:hypothetical protein [Pyrinomonadaceae bacterium]
PWFKKRHAKRRMVNAELVDMIVSRLAAKGKIFVQTDIEPLAEEMFALFEADERLKMIDEIENPFPVKTERELAVESRQLRVYRKSFQKS